MSLNEKNPSVNRPLTQPSEVWGPTSASAPESEVVYTSSASKMPDAISAGDQKKWIKKARVILLQAAIPMVLAWLVAMALPFFNYGYYKWATSVLVCAVCWATGCVFYSTKLLKLSLKDRR